MISGPDFFFFQTVKIRNPNNLYVLCLMVNKSSPNKQNAEAYKNIFLSGLNPESLEVKKQFQ